MLRAGSRDLSRLWYSNTALPELAAPNGVADMRCLFACVVLFGLSLSPGFISSRSACFAQDEPGSGTERERPRTAQAAAAAAMTTIFSPARAPKQKTMGLLQRSFLDLASQGEQELEVAVVVDGTQSMASELAGVRQTIQQMLDDLKRYRNNEVRAAIVVYRDAGSPSGDVAIPLREFSSDPDEIKRAVATLQPESGAPFFHELPDLGLHHALAELPWSDDDQITKWILLFGDAPPYAESFRDRETPEAYRRYATSILVSMAKQKNIRINCVLCTSSDAAAESYDKSIDQTRRFMNELAAGTDGLMLDLSYEAIRTAMIDASRQPDVPLTKIEPITAIDLAAVRSERATPQSVRHVRVAVLPHMPLDRVSFDARHPAVRVSTALRSQLARLPGVRVASPRDIKEQLRRLRAEGISDDQAMRGLAARLGVDYVIWGNLDPSETTVRTAAYRRADGLPIAPVQLKHRADNLVPTLIAASAKQSPEDQGLQRLVRHIERSQDAPTVTLANSDATRDELLSAMEALDHALAFETGSDAANEFLDLANRASRSAIAAEPDNAMAHWLQANVAYNQAASLFRRGDRKAAAERMNDMRSALGESIKYRENLRLPGLKTEVEADYYLLMRRDPEKAVERYVQLTEKSQPSASQLRGHWMLAGIHAGDWGTSGQPVVDPDKSRYHITQVLANWPDSPEANLLKRWLRWDETNQQTEFNYLPIVHAL